MTTHSFKAVLFLFLGVLVGCSSEGSGGISADELEIVPRGASECATDRCGEYPEDGCSDWHMNDGYPDECMLDCRRGGPTEPIAVRFECREVHIVSCKDLSNVVVAFRDGEHYKYDGLKGHYGTFGAGDKEIVTVWVKAGNNASGNGPGYGERFDAPSDVDCGNGGAGGTGGDDGMGGAGGAGASTGAGGMSGTGGKDCHCDCDDGDSDGDDDGDSDGYCDDDDFDHGVDCKVGVECPHGGKYGHIEVDFECHEAHIASCKELSNVVIEFEDGERRKYDDLDGHCATLGVGEREIVGVWVKAGNNKSGDGPGYGTRYDSGARCDRTGGTGGMGGQGGMAGSGGVGGAPREISFAADIQPYFEPGLADCVDCHSGGGPKGVDLDSYANILAGGNSGPLVVPGDSADPTASLVPKLNANHHNGPDDAGFVVILSQWIDEGALDN